MSEWQPIETAPKDGRYVLCFARGKHDAGSQNAREDQWRVDHFSRRGVWWRMLPETPYTHWQPLPPPPEASP